MARDGNAPLPELAEQTMCDGKAGYPTFGVAQEIAGRKRKRRGEPYHCPYCKSWHVGRSKRLRKPKKRKIIRVNT